MVLDLLVQSLSWNCAYDDKTSFSCSNLVGVCSLFSSISDSRRKNNSTARIVKRVVQLPVTRFFLLSCFFGFRLKKFILAGKFVLQIQGAITFQKRIFCRLILRRHTCVLTRNVTTPLSITYGSAYNPSHLCLSIIYYIYETIPNIDYYRFAYTSQH